MVLLKHQYQENPSIIMRFQKALTLLIFIAFCAIVLVVGVSLPVSAQDVPPPMLPGGPDQTPVDGGLLALGAAGAGYAIKKLRDRRSKLTDRTEHTDE